jgi:hypothetical protein
LTAICTVSQRSFDGTRWVGFGDVITADIAK